MSSNVVLTPEDIQSFEEFYRRRLAEAGGSQSYEHDAEIVRDMLRAVREDGMTPTADGGVSIVRRGGMDWTDPGAIDAAQAATGKKGRGASAGGEGGAKDMLLGALLLGAVVVGAIWYFGFRGKGEDVKAEDLMIEATTTAVSDADLTPIPTLESDLLADIVEGGVKTKLMAPRTLEIKGVSFVVQAVKIDSGDWRLPDDERAVSWVYGTVVNYVMGVEATPENKALLASLGAGDELLLRMSTGPAYRFAYVDAVRVAPQASEIFRQSRPGLTLVLMGEEGQATRVVIRALYLPESEQGTGAPAASKGQVVAPGQSISLGQSLSVSVLESYPLPHASAPPGYVALGVDYRLENSGQQAIAAAQFQHRIEAEGVTYAAVPGVVNQTAHPPLPTAIQAGEAVTVTAVYAIPESLLRSGSVWVFSPDIGGSIRGQVALPPYIGSLVAEVSVKEVQSNEGGLEVLLDIHAPLEDVILATSDIQVSGGMIDLAGSGFPWQVGARERKQFLLRLQPAGETMQIALLGQGFEFSIQQ